MGAIVWIFIVGWIVIAVLKSKNKAGAKNPPPVSTMNPPPRPVTPMKQKPIQKPVQGDILQRAKASVAEDFSSSHVHMGEHISEQKISPEETARKRQELIARMAVEKCECSEEVEPSNIMAKVEDLMIKGPDVSLTFERDFIAEGADMLNRISMM